jgi:hypothetical protein
VATTLNDIRIAILTPMGSNIYPKNVTCFLNLASALHQVFHPASRFFWLEGGPYLVQNRTYLLRAAMMHDFSQKFDYLLWIDADQVFGIEHICMLAACCVAGNLDAVSGLYYNRHGDRHSMAGRIVNEDNDIYWLQDRDFAVHRVQQTVIPIDICGFGFFMMKMEGLRQYCQQYPREKWFTESWHGLSKMHYSGEDVSFCHQFKALGRRIWFAPHVAVGHYGGIVPSDFKQSNATNRFEEVNII